eukprot:XP_011601225.1 PREDICTED: phosphoinositide 3-kinase adapter protein 1 isoform X3 [Takifugu rubripes]
MEEPVSNASANSVDELLVVYTADAHEWAIYLQQILKSTRKLRKASVVLYAISPADQLHGYNFEYFQSYSCILVLVSGELLGALQLDLELQAALQKLFYPPHRVVALLCGVSQDDMLQDVFPDWPRWRKVSAEDEPTVYISATLESVTESSRVPTEVTTEVNNSAATSDDAPAEGKESASEQQPERIQKDEEQMSTENLTKKEPSPARPACLTIQPNRLLCGEEQQLFIIFTHQFNHQTSEVEFSSKNGETKRVAVTLENEYTISVNAPDMPAGVVSLTMYTGPSSVSLGPVTYYTIMGEVSRYLEKAVDPVTFICQAFNLTSNARESLDNMLTESLKSRMPASSFQLFGIRQIEEINMDAYQRDEELPTLLHFAAKYGLKKLTTVLLQCPGALQAYSVMNKHGDYPNTLAEKRGFSDLRQFMDEYVETAAILKSHFEGAINTEKGAEVYELMSATSEDIMMKYSGGPEDIYESMLGIDPECAEDLYEVMSAVNDNPEEAMLRKFFQAKPHGDEEQIESDSLQSKVKKEQQSELHHVSEEEEDPYSLTLEDIYDTVDANNTYSPNSTILNRAPAPIPRPEQGPEPEQPVICRVFSDKARSNGSLETEQQPCAAQPVGQPPSPVYDPYAGMKTPGQRQLISLQERVKVGEITVDEAVQEFKAWQFDHKQRACSIRYQHENLKRLRDSITRRHKERQKPGEELDYEISAPLQRSLFWGSNVTQECAIYEPSPRVTHTLPQAAPQVIQRGTWKTGSTSSTSSTESNRLSIHSTCSYSSGTEPDFEDMSEICAPPPRPPRSSDATALNCPPRIPPRVPERIPEHNLHERYIRCPIRAIPQRPLSHSDSPPPLPRRQR